MSIAVYHIVLRCVVEEALYLLWSCSDNQTTFMQERITKVEKNFGDLCDGFAKYARGVAKLRDRGEQIRHVMFIFTYA